MRLLLSTALAFSIVLGCATSPKVVMPPAPKNLPPEFEITERRSPDQMDVLLLDLERQSKDKPTKWWSRYRRAQLWQKDQPQISCGLYSLLSEESEFPLRKMAALRAYQVCEKLSPAVTEVAGLSSSDPEPWMKDLVLDIELDHARLQKNSAREMELLIEKSKLNLPRELKVDYTKEALAIATHLKKSDLVNEYTERLHKLAPRLKPNPDRSDFLEVAYDFRRIRNFPAARKYYFKVITSKRFPAVDKIKALKGVRATYKIERNDKKYLEATKKLAKYTQALFAKKKSQTHTRLYVDAYLLWARTLWTKDQIKGSQQVLKTLAKTVQGRHSLMEAYWIRGRMLEEKQDFANALWWFNKALKEPKTDAELFEKLQWLKAWNLRKIKSFDAAVDQYKELIATTESDFNRYRYMFWLGRTYKDMNQWELSKVVLTQLQSEDPIGYYGIVARRELDQPLSVLSPNAIDGPRTPASLHTLPSPLNEMPDSQFIAWLTAVNEDEVARSYLDEIASGYRKVDPQDAKVWESLFKHYALSGNYLGLFYQLGQMPAAERQQLLVQHPEIVFPTPFDGYVNAAANKYGISAEFIYAIMRQESAFNPRARSPMDAFGLMQLLPEVAAQSAKGTDVEFTQAEDLYIPAVNIPLGSRFLRQLWDKYNGQFIPAVASYNASEDAIAGWLKTRYRGDSLEFIEDIPYEETKSYVKLVMRNMIFYKMQSAQNQSIQFPEWALEL
ncbi:MAG: lytic transglycosylase domain-containing protein [Pseudobdellovibrionaceae bacterium]|nr:lytic transglycosylase domain-containing protein [Bdellovibrionales bacterium]USN47614.1 MAG: lytic transglycosylase domain-containing protein [Pseudobdellovibrionaceae bacterium]